MKQCEIEKVVVK